MQPEIRSFVSVLRSPVTPFDRGKTKSANFTKNANCFEECSVGQGLRGCNELLNKGHLCFAIKRFFQVVFFFELQQP